MRGAGRQISVMQIVRLDAACDERAHERPKRFDIVIDAAQQHRLRQHRNARIDQPRASRACLLRQLARMIGMQHDKRRLVGA